MLAWIRFLLSGLVLTGWYSLEVIFAALRRAPNKPGGVYDRVPYDWARALIAINRISVDVEGLDRIPAGTPCVFAANHLSVVDIWLLLVVLPGRLRFMAKREISHYPLLGTALRAAHHIFIDRKDLSRALEAYREAALVMRSGMSAIVFVEGTRSRDGVLKPFKKGAFVLAIAAGAPVVPVRIDGTFEMLPPGSLAFRSGKTRVRIGRPLLTSGLSYDDRDDLMARCREEILGLGDGNFSD
jgi:1-acyl-sn-glycerol-3-phosphate acyltransferase